MLLLQRVVLHARYLGLVASPVYPVFARCLSAGALGPCWGHDQAQGSQPGPGGAAPHADTIFALSSGQGRSAVAVIRLSGPGADAALAALLLPQQALPAPRSLALATLRHPHSRELLDRALVARFPGEDCAELHVHGGPAVVRCVLGALGALPWVRTAEAGEFCRRAFEAGKLDLTEVEGLADLLRAETEGQRRQALAHSGGEARRRYEGWRSMLLTALARVEAVIDFGEDEGIADEVAAGVLPIMLQLRGELERHLAGGRAGELVREGVRVAIVGPPNAGKSSLLNALAGRDAAIVSPIPGTTRDTVEVALDLGGYKVVVTDSAGLRATEDPIEAEGVGRALRAAREAHVVLLVQDASSAAAAAGDASATAKAWDASGDLVTAFQQPSTAVPEQNGGGGGVGGVNISSGHSWAAFLPGLLGAPGPAAAAPHLGGNSSVAEAGPGPSADISLPLVLPVLNKLDLLRAPSLTASTAAGPSVVGRLHGHPRQHGPNHPEQQKEGGKQQQSWDIGATAPPASTPQQARPIGTASRTAPTTPQPPSMAHQANSRQANNLEASSSSALLISCATGEGLDALLFCLQAAVESVVCTGGDPGAVALVARERHRRHLRECVAALGRYEAAAMQVEIGAEELRAAAKALGRVTGAIDTEAVLDSVFREFCIGK